MLSKPLQIIFFCNYFNPNRDLFGTILPALDAMKYTFFIERAKKNTSFNRNTSPFEIDVTRLLIIL